MLKTSMIIELIDKVTGPARRMEASLASFANKAKAQFAGVAKATSAVGDNIGKTTTEARKLSTRLAVLGGGAAWLIKSQLVDTASKFEQFRTVLETVEGSSSKAARSMDWVSEFAAKTPYELDQVMDAFVKLRAYGMNPTDGLLRTLGDTASAMGKPLIMAVEAIADAVTGENERLKEFGIKAQTKGDRIRYEYSDREGKTQFKYAKSDNREQIRDTLTAIWNERYSGAMEKMSKTYAGMMSNLADQWTRFKMMIMQAGAFDFLKGKLEGLLSKVDQMAANGQLKALAKEWGRNLVEGLKAAYGAATALLQIMQGLGRVISWLAGVMGGYKNLGIAVAALMAGKLVFSVVSLAGSFITLGKVALPLVSLGLKAIVPLLSTVSAALPGIIASITPLLPWVAAIIGGWLVGWKVGKGLNKGIGKLFDKGSGGKYKGEGAIGEWTYDLFHPQDKQPKAPALRLAPSRPTINGTSPINRQPHATTARTEVGGEISLKIESDSLVRVKGIKSVNKGVPINVYTGLMMRSH
jgi:phage tail tape-measure protein